MRGNRSRSQTHTSTIHKTGEKLKAGEVIHYVPKKKHVTTFLMISWSRTVCFERFLAHLLL